MTDVTRPVKRVSSARIHEAGKDRKIVVIIKPHGVIAFRAKGCKREYQLTVDACYSVAVKAHVAKAEREKKKAKVKRRKARKASSRRQERRSSRER